MLNSSDQTPYKLQQMNKNLMKTLEQKDKELEHERSLWKARLDVDIHTDVVSANLLHILDARQHNK